MVLGSSPLNLLSALSDRSLSNRSVFGGTQGRVLDAVSQSPIPGVDIEFRHSTQVHDADQRITSNDKGYFSFDPQAVLEGTIVLRAEGYVPREIPWRRFAIVDDHFVLLQPGIETQGTVRTRQGLATGGSIVLRTGFRALRNTMTQGHRFRTDIDTHGQFRTFVPPGNYLVIAKVPKYAPAWSPFLSTWQTNQVNLFAEPGREARGKVIDCDGAPILGATVTGVFKFWNEPFEFTTKTSESGRFEFHVGVADLFALRIEAQGFSSLFHPDPWGGVEAHRRLTVFP